jgi:hypothetical protein
MRKLPTSTAGIANRKVIIGGTISLARKEVIISIQVNPPRRTWYSARLKLMKILIRN